LFRSRTTVIEIRHIFQSVTFSNPSLFQIRHIFQSITFSNTSHLFSLALFYPTGQTSDETLNPKP